MEAQTTKNRIKIVFETDVFCDTYSSTDFFDFSPFWVDFKWMILGGPGDPKILKIVENRVRGAYGKRLDLQYDFGDDV